MLRAVAVLEVVDGAGLQVRVADVHERRWVLEFDGASTWYVADEPDDAPGFTAIPNVDERWLVIEAEAVSQAPADTLTFALSEDELAVLDHLRASPASVDASAASTAEALAARGVVVAVDGGWAVDADHRAVLDACGEAAPLITVRKRGPIDDDVEIRLCGGSPMSVQVEPSLEGVRFASFPTTELLARLLDLTGLAAQPLRPGGDDPPEDVRFVTCAILAIDHDGDVAGGFTAWFDLGASGVMLVEESSDEAERTVRVATAEEIADELVSYLPEDLRERAAGRQGHIHQH